MTNPINKKTHEQFVSEVPTSLKIEITGRYVNTDTKITYRCKHGENSALPWQILKLKHCCRKGFYESGKMWERRSNSLEKLRERALKSRSNIDVSETYLDTSGKYKMLAKIKCLLHNVYYDSIGCKKIGQCPICFKNDCKERIKKVLPKAWASRSIGSFVSKSESKWLDSLGIIERQYWLEDVKYKVDGYDPATNTVYLYHGRFWHGCPETFDPEMIHPVVKIPMKMLYEKTMLYENKIKEAGYNLVVKWGT